jgi:hypothetical protein
VSQREEVERQKEGKEPVGGVEDHGRKEAELQRREEQPTAGKRAIRGNGGRVTVEGIS